MSILIFVVSFVISFSTFPILISQLKRVRIVGKDMHKPGRPEVPEMGGLGIVAGFVVGVISAIALESFFGNLFPVDSRTLLAALGMILIITVIGILDDLFRIGQGIKALLPLLAALPLMSVKSGQTTMILPFLGKIDFGIFYPTVLVPLGTTGAANAVNILAGFNGLEVGMGLVAMGSLAAIAAILQATTALVLLLAGLGALLAALYYNWYPAKMLIGDVGALTIGAIIAAAAIVGNFELGGAIVIAPHFFDFIIKGLHRFPSQNWWGEYNKGKLYCPKSGPVGLCQWIMKFFGGISERRLVLTLIAVQVVLGLIAVLWYTRSQF